MMKRIKFFAICFCVCCLLYSCGNTTESTEESGTEETRMLMPADVILDGEHHDLLAVSENPRLILTNINKGEWIIQVVVPMTNTKTWDVWTKELNDGSTLAPNLEYDACMSNLLFTLLDKSGKPIECKMELTGDNVESLLSAESEASEEVSAKTYKTGTYSAMKAIYDQIAGISIQNMELDKIQHSVMTNSLGVDAEDINFDEIYKQAKRTYDETTRENDKNNKK